MATRQGGRVTERLPALMDCTQIQQELGVKRAFAEALMRGCPKITVEGVRKVYVKRTDVLRELERRQVAA